MEINDIASVAVVGAGTMGSGIAQVFAQAGYPTLLFDIGQQAVDKARASITANLDKSVEIGKMKPHIAQQTLDNLRFSTEFGSVKAHLVLEAIVEDLQAKADLFNALHLQNHQDTVFATNTSTIPITQLGAMVPLPGRLVGMHFFNPAHIMKLVEVISGLATRTDVADTCCQLALKLGKKPVMANDSPGFIVNRVARHYYVEALKLLEEGVADLESIDRVMEASGFKMGPFKLMDLIGMDTNFAVTSTLYKAFHYDPKFRPSRIQEQKVQAGHLGRKTGLGFYHYP
ncbi:MAG: 3-hydroxybutyryl-CoA dehydrogenase [Bacteroidetes bacterium]|jgi:3-hydroxybutyryl-CoA dehydrogenase|nr:3-hydroxybutyryl-CoA dehydrogenase [Bacteroidota bacterium]